MVGKMLLELESRFLLGQEGLNFLVKSVKEIVTVSNQFDLPNLKLENLGTESRRQKFYSEKFFFIKPKSIFLGYDKKRVKKRVKSVRCFGYSVPLIESLRVRLQLPEYKTFININIPEKDTEYYDGTFPSCETDPRIKIHLGCSFDDIEVQVLQNISNINLSCFKN